jgi:Ni,Fe-hydrogenase III large subunit
MKVADCTIPFGPQHPYTKEPACLYLSLSGNDIERARIRLGYNHKGIEKMFEGKDVNYAAYIAERICGICSHCHNQCYTQAVESISGIEIPERVSYIRVLITELERIHSHLLWLGFLCHEIGIDTLFMYFLKEREKILDVFEKLTGGRVHHAVNKIGTVRHDLTKEDLDFTKKTIKEIRKNLDSYFPMFLSDPVAEKRLSGVGVIKKAEAEMFGVVGPVARASGVKCDIRKKTGYERFSEFDFNEIIKRRGDSLERSKVRIDEMKESMHIVDQTLDRLEDGKVPKHRLQRVKDGETVTRVEAPRGENFYFMRIEKNQITRAKVRTPSLANISVVEQLLTGRTVGDVPVIVNSLDPCFSCMERVMVEKKGKREVMGKNEFRRRFS